MARKRAITPLKKTAMATAQKKQTASAAAVPNPRRSTRGTATQPPIYAEPDASDDEDNQLATTKKKAKTPAQSEQDQSTEGPPAPRYNTRLKQAQLSEQSLDAALDDDNVEEIPRVDDYPLYKDDLPNAFNGTVDQSLDFISRAPTEVIDNILSYLVLDHDPDRGVKIKAGTYKPVPHVLLSMAAMSRLFYHSTEGFARRYRTKNKLPQRPAIDWSPWPTVAAQMKLREEEEHEKEHNRRRSVRIANIPRPETHDFHRRKLWCDLTSHCAICLESGWRPGELANHVTVCETCERSVFGEIMVRRPPCVVELITNYNA
jgi:hypothetical protein